MHVSQNLIQLLKDGVPTVVLTGAGVSAESGVPTFRGGDGLWNKFDPRELASFDAFIRNPKLVWEWYLWRRNLIAEVKPNGGHYTLGAMEKSIPDFTLVTQNVDNLHRIAGSQNVIELHGNIMRNKCCDCNRPMEGFEFNPDHLPQCECGGGIRPDVVWFGEYLPENALEEATDKSRAAKLFFSIGTSTEVYPAAELPFLARRSGAYVVEINPDETGLSQIADEVYRGKSGEILPLIWQTVQESMAKQEA